MLSHPNATLAPQARPSSEIFNYLLSHYSDILSTYDHCISETLVRVKILKHDKQSELGIN